MKCGVCGTDGVKIYACGACGLAKYCSRRCQSRDYRSHISTECKRYRSVGAKRDLSEGWDGGREDDARTGDDADARRGGHRGADKRMKREADEVFGGITLGREALRDSPCPVLSEREREELAARASKELGGVDPRALEGPHFARADAAVGKISADAAAMKSMCADFMKPSVVAGAIENMARAHGSRFHRYCKSWALGEVTGGLVELFRAMERAVSACRPSTPEQMASYADHVAAVSALFRSYYDGFCPYLVKMSVSGGAPGAEKDRMVGVVKGIRSEVRAFAYDCDMWKGGPPLVAAKGLVSLLTKLLWGVLNRYMCVALAVLSVVPWHMLVSVDAAKALGQSARSMGYTLPEVFREFVGFPSTGTWMSWAGNAVSLWSTAPKRGDEYSFAVHAGFTLLTWALEWSRTLWLTINSGVTAVCEGVVAQVGLHSALVGPMSHTATCALAFGTYHFSWRAYKAVVRCWGDAQTRARLSEAVEVYSSVLEAAASDMEKEGAWEEGTGERT